jgi:hypothetical protein
VRSLLSGAKVDAVGRIEDHLVSVPDIDRRGQEAISLGEGQGGGDGLLAQYSLGLGVTGADLIDQAADQSVAEGEVKLSVVLPPHLAVVVHPDPSLGHVSQVIDVLPSVALADGRLAEHPIKV